ncbi:MAG: S8 family serine peptidase [Rivularia sp. T60_A2020_040]|nr:S8 family serine peptidase [Rivularia sp. T60_A2020_040]
MSTNANSPENFPSNIPTSSLGMIIQRGGEELVLEKLPDRFTVRSNTNIPVPQLARNFLGSWRSSIPTSRLELFRVASTKLEMAMSQARSSTNVAFASHVYQIKGNPGTAVYLSDQMTIQFASWVDNTRIKSIAAKFGLVLDKPVDGLPNTFVFIVGQQATQNPIKIANQLQGLSEILASEPNIIIRQESYYKPRDPLYFQQWYLNHNGGNQLAHGSHISVEKAWDITRGVRSVVVAVVDDSFDLNHPDFMGSGKIVAPLNLKDQDFLPIPTQEQPSHGTACAGIAIASENGTGIAGVAPGCGFMPIRTSGFLDDESIEAIFDWALEKGASVISCSWGASAVYFPLSLRQRAAITRAATKGRNGKGCVILFAAGNANRPINGTVYESGWVKDIVTGKTRWLSGFAVHPDVITVSASTSLNKKAAYSNWGSNISICAPSNNAQPGMWFEQTGFIYTQPAIAASLPGKGMFTTDQLGAAGYSKDDFTPYFGGTSAATPVVAGVAALVLSANPDLTAQQVKRILEETADKIVDLEPDPQLGLRYGSYDDNGHSQWFGYGKVNAENAVKAAHKLQINAAIATKNILGRNNVILSIPDNYQQGIKSPIMISESSNVRDIQVSVDITHEFLSDLEIYLIAPNNQRVLLQSRTLGRRQELQTTYSVQTHASLKNLLNQSAQGNWQLWIIDTVPQDTGKLNNWQLLLSVNS